MRNRKKRLPWVCLILVSLWAAFALTRYSPFTTYIPLSGKLFAENVEDADVIFLQNGTTGEQYFFETAEEKAEIAEILNGLRYRFWIPDLPVARGGWSYRIAIETKTRQYSYSFGSNYLTVNGIIYFLPEGQLDVLTEYVT